ncbi:hypothetical protein D9757_009947 [Collybiopsis confluens]|uniref:Uncharacterized protein n=1 Tax=Collybiopsis confluens TaxID=2823264 RepID=A0A8H5H2Z7_9AGAR|nr:hypothetical protein D9757_009947 [Collybiopsis confluens]
MIFAKLACSLALATGVFAQYGYGPAPASSSSATSAAAPVPSAPPSTSTQINIDVAFNGNFVFNPNNVTAPVGSQVTFYFPGGQIPHSVTQSSFANPCTYLEANSTAQTGPGFDSGLTNAVQFTLNITDDQPSGSTANRFYTALNKRVQSDNMLYIAPSNGSNTFDAFHSAAIQLGNSEVTQTSGGPVTGGVHGVATAPPSAASGTSGSGSGSSNSSSSSSGSSGSGSSSASANGVSMSVVMLFAAVSAIWFA